jgi:hypothetical protein
MSFNNVKIDDIWDKNFQNYSVSIPGYEYNLSRLSRRDYSFPYGFNTGDQNIYFLALNDPINPLAGTKILPASGFNFIVGASGSLNLASRSFVSGINSMVVGGLGNVTRGNSSAVIGGSFNRLNSSNSSAIVGGENNTILRSNNSVILGGTFNCMASGSNVFFMGVGESNCGQGQCSVLLGGCQNTNLGNYAFLGAGFGNCIVTSTTANTLVGGTSNIVNGNYNFLGGGSYNGIDTVATYSIIGGGLLNCAGGQGTAILGGFCNKVLVSNTNPTNNTIVGGCKNCMSFPVPYGIDRGNFIGGGKENLIGSSSSKASYSVIVGGDCNTLDDTTHSAILGGCCNSLSNGCDSFILGSRNTTAAARSFIIGQNSTIVSTHSGAGIISDGTNILKTSQGQNTLTLDFISGTYIKNRTILQSDSYVPSTYTSYGVSGQLAFDPNYFYRHNGTNWTRTALSIW